MSKDNAYLGYIEAYADLARNRTDGFYEDKKRTADEKGMVAYVFDSDIVEMFVNPYRYFINQKENRTSENRCWMFDWGLNLTRRPKGDRDDDLKSVMPELAMITAEYLISGWLPGSDGRIYFTPWHHREVSNQCRHLINTLSRNSTQVIVSGVHSTVELYKTAVESADKDGWESAANKLMQHLSRDPTSEPYEQLCRLLSILKSDRVRLISDYYRLDQREWSKAKEDYDFFVDKIGHRVENRPVENLQHDALSLSLIARLSIEASKNGEKIVFVTGDKALFECYSDWFYRKKNADPIGFDLPFVARRVSQYTPILNISSARSDISIEKSNSESRGAKEIFDALEEIVMAASTMYSSRSSTSKYDSFDDIDEADRYYWRSWFSREQLDESSIQPIENKDTSSLLNKTKEQMTFLQKRSSILFSKYMKKRLDERYSKAFSSAAGSDVFDIVKKEVKERINRLHQQVEPLLTISDRKNILLLYGLNLRGLHRLPDTISYKIGGDNGSTISDIINGLEAGEGDNYRNQFRYFDFVDMRAFGAAVALAAHNWGEANFYAGRALELARAKRNFDPKSYSELVFLQCITGRYYLADSLWANYDAGKATENLKIIRRSLKSIYRYVGRRGLSEEAALLLFVFQCGMRNSIGGDGGLAYLREATYLLSDAWEAGQKKSETAVDDQILHNIASVFLFGAIILGEQREDCHSHTCGEVLKILQILPLEAVRESVYLSIVSVGRDASKFLRLESAFFLYLFAIPDYPHEYVVRLIDEVKPADNLGMDVALAKKIKILLENIESFRSVQTRIKTHFPDVP